MYLKRENLNGRLTEIMNDIICNELELETVEDIDVVTIYESHDSEEIFVYPTSVKVKDMDNKIINIDIKSSISSYLDYRGLLDYKSEINTAGIEKLLHETEHDNVRVIGSIEDRVTITILHKVIPDFVVLKVVNPLKAELLRKEVNNYIKAKYSCDINKLYNSLTEPA
ncbi:hypothetical protein [Paraclostridium bifermentans]|uniref:hypothetical protein n=1 Tax=Paraclostridium bifermentans TaxID=1490 RepID=UPI00374F8824